MMLVVALFRFLATFCAFLYIRKPAHNIVMVASAEEESSGKMV
jgi:hypothetical protein